MERILALPSSLVTQRIPTGLVKINEQELLDLVAQEGKYFDRTPQLEEDTTLKQIVAYVMVECQGKLLMYQRAAKNGDTRLRKKFSIGFGGHVNSEDGATGQNPVIAGRTREISEEIALPASTKFEFVGTLNIARAPIDQFHLGAVYKTLLTSPDYKLNEPESFDFSGWVTPAELAARYTELESWSQEVFGTLYPQLYPQLLAATT